VVRLTAWRILRSGSPTPLRDVDRAAAAGEIDERDRGLLRRIVGTEIRRRATLRAIVRHVVPRSVDADMAAHLHVALAQVFFLDKVPEHAVRSELSDAVRRTLGAPKVRHARESLRRAYEQLQQGHTGDPRRDLELRNAHLRDPIFPDPREHPLLWGEQALSMPAALLKRWGARHGEERAFALARRALEEPPLSIRAVRGERAELARELEAAGARVREGVHERILLAPAADAEIVASHAAFLEGRVTIQGETALRAAEALEPRPGEELLDLCSAPGGKTAVLAAAGARVVACDLRPERLERVGATLDRLRSREMVELVRADAGEALGERAFDGVLVDAPCTNTGVLAQRPEARWRFGPRSRAELGELQARLFAAGADRVRPGGRLVWSTCSLEPEENRRAVEAFLALRPQWTLEAEAEALPDVATTQERGGGPIDGGYHARLRRGPR
jgi:16S rRNA (cytosine967-C5)-methyltransferase